MIGIHMEPQFRFAEEKDTGLILEYIKYLAEYERMLDLVIATEEDLRKWIFEKEKAEVLFIMENGNEVGFAVFFHNFSTFLGRAGIYLEDLYIKPEFRGKGIRKSDIQKARIYCKRTRMRQSRVVVPRLEQTIYRFLSLSRC